MVWSPLHGAVHQVLRSRSLLPARSHLLIALSGGQDSMALLQLLRDLQPHWHWHLHIFHGDHGWRSDSATQAQEIAQWLHTQSLPHTLVTAPPLPHTEAAARTWRYQALATVALAHHCSHIVTGHTASDRAETLLHNLLRGSGADGLQALAWQRPLTPKHPDLTLVRPLLQVTRQETGDFCQSRDLPLWLDSSNDDPAYTRNRIRQELLPLLRQFNPQVEQTLAATADRLSADVAYLEAEVERHWPTCAQIDPPRLHRPDLQPLPLALQRRLIRRWLSHLLPRTPTSAHIEKVLFLLDAPQGSQSDPFPGGAIPRVDHPWIWLVPPLP